VNSVPITNTKLNSIKHGDGPSPRRANLEALERRAEELIGALSSHRDELLIAPSAELMESQQQASQREIEFDRLAARSQEFAMVRRAMEAVRDGTYGVCCDCGEVILPKRLEAVPWALRCVRCQEGAELEQGVESTAFDWEPQSGVN
jgi:DnaK suppressor protein